MRLRSTKLPRRKVEGNGGCACSSHRAEVLNRSSSRSAGQKERDRNIRSMRDLGRREWYANSGYSRRSVVENAVFRYKTIFGARMRSRSMANQRAEVALACKILNTMTALGMPDSLRAA